MRLTAEEEALFEQFDRERLTPDQRRDRLLESLSGHIPRSSLRSSDLLPFYHQYPAACCGDFYFTRAQRRARAHAAE